SGQSLVSIIESGEIWATQVSCLNDESELRYAVRLLRQALHDRRAAATPTPDEEYLYDRIEAELSVDTTASSEWFVACFSQVDDDLSQWRAYGGGEGGYAIGLLSSALGEVGARDQSYLAPVC